MGYTLLEILLAMGLCAILAAASVPLMSGWWSEYKLRSQFGSLVSMVQSAKLEAEKSGSAKLVVLQGREGFTPESSTNVLIFSIDGNSDWEVVGFGGGKKETAEIRIDQRGYVEPVSVRLTQGDKFIECRFDFLTGHAHEEQSSF